MFAGGLPKPINVAELFDRDNLTARPIIGYKNGSGYTQANVDHGAQNRSTTQFPIYARHVSPEAKTWRGHYYGVNALKPCMEPIMLAQKPIATGRVIDNLRQYGTGSLNLGALEDRQGAWPTTVLEHKKAKKADHQSDHISVKPTALLEDLCVLLCPPGGKILDPFAGTGSTGIAALKNNFECVLIEQDPAMEPVIRRRTATSPV
jgi:site-specific DNA-methyltransferase (adenine-specific)